MENTQDLRTAVKTVGAALTLAITEVVLAQIGWGPGDGGS